MATRKSKTQSPRDRCAVSWRYPVRITVTSYRKRLCDADGISAKAAIDGLVHRGLLSDDGPQYVSEVVYRQIKAKDEKTVIDIEDDR